MTEEKMMEELRPQAVETYRDQTCTGSDCKS